jgi:hypothetical protein
MRGSDQEFDPNSRPVLSASEIAQFVFCREAWYIERQGLISARNPLDRREQGRAAHREIGRRTDALLRSERRVRDLLVVFAIFATALLIVVVAWSWGLRWL